jgi:acyl-CoA dehydrogenase
MTTATEIHPATTLTLAEIVDKVGPAIASYAAEHDRDGTFVTEAYAALKSAGFFSAAVPQEFGGLGAGLRELVLAHQDLARFCGSASLASAMHTHTVATLAWRHRRGAPVAATLQKVADGGLLLISTGGSDLVHPSATARKVDDGFVVNGRKVFASQAQVATMLATSAVVEGDSPEIIMLSIPMSAPGVRILETWDAHGMRGTGSNDILLEDVFVPDAQAGARRPLDKLDPLIRIALINGLTIITGVYLGLVRAARDTVVANLSGGHRAANPVTQRLVGQVEYEFEAASLALEGALARLGDDPESTFDNFRLVVLAKRAVAEHGMRAIEAAMAAMGGHGYYRTSPLERIARDFRAIAYHPLPPEATLFYAGRVALGGDPEDL